jgi:hypothetical protein
MTIEIYISIFGALTAIIVSIVGALLTKRNSIILQTRKLKESHYVAYIEALHSLASNNQSSQASKDYTFNRDKLFLVASEEVIAKMLDFENKAVGKESDLHDQYLTELVREIRKDLKIKDKNFPKISLKK